jgi:hypothetical protein
MKIICSYHVAFLFIGSHNLSITLNDVLCISSVGCVTLYFLLCTRSHLLSHVTETFSSCTCLASLLYILYGVCHLVDFHVSRVRLCLSSVATIPQVIYKHGKPLLKDTDGGGGGEAQRTLKDTCHSSTLTTTNPTWTDPGLCCEGPATNHLSHDMALCHLERCMYFQLAYILLVSIHFEISGWGGLKLVLFFYLNILDVTIMYAEHNMDRHQSYGWFCINCSGKWLFTSVTSQRWFLPKTHVSWYHSKKYKRSCFPLYVNKVR